MHMMRMQVMNAERFFGEVAACRGDVWLRLSAQSRVSLKNDSVVRDLLMLKKGVLPLSVEAELSCDRLRLFRFMLEDAA